MDGWIKIHRKIQENPWIYKDNDYLSVWINLLLLASFSEKKQVFGNKVILLKAGQLITGRKELSRVSMVNESKVERILKRFEIEQQIEQQKNSKGRLITIVNWERYQGIEQQTDK